MFDILANGFLSFGHEIVLLPLAVLGYVWLDRRIFFHGICLVLLSIILTFALKITFKMPLPSGKEGYVFPSGQMQSITVFYGWLALKMPRRFWKGLWFILLAGNAFGLLYFQYVGVRDILGALFFGTLLLLVYQALVDSEKGFSFLTFLAATLLMVYIHNFAVPKEELWQAYYALVGFMAAESFFAPKVVSQSFMHKLMATFLSFGVIGFAKLLPDLGLHDAHQMYLQQIYWLLIGLSLPWAASLPERLFKSQVQVST